MCVYTCDLYLESRHYRQQHHQPLKHTIFVWQKRGKKIIIVGIYSVIVSTYFSLNKRRICFFPWHVFLYQPIFMLFNVSKLQWLNVLSTLTTRNCNLGSRPFRGLLFSIFVYECVKFSKLHQFPCA